MIVDDKKWNIGLARLAGFMQHLSSSIDKEGVDQFHSIVATLEEASGESLSDFKIPAETLAHRVTSVRPGGYGGGQGSVTYSQKKFCDSSYFRAQVHGLSNYVQILCSKSSPKAKAANTSVPPQPLVTNVYHLSGPNARVNVQSTDQSVNQVVTSEQLFETLRETIQSGIPKQQQPEILARLDALERAQNDKSFGVRYTEFITAAANHMTILAPFIPALSELLHKVL
jgi:hypothetical protein